MPGGILIRAATVALDKHGGRGLEEAIRITNSLEKCFEDNGIGAWTFRVILPPLSNENNCGTELAAKIASLPPGILVNAYAMDEDISRKCLEKVLNIVEANSQVYGSLLCSSAECLKHYLASLWSAGKTPVAYTRIASLLGSGILTPYFPATYNEEMVRGLMLAFRYVDRVLDLIRGAISLDILLEEFNDIAYRVEKAAKCAGLEVLGADYSLSPWMEESVAEVIETLAGTRLGSIGSFHGVYELNKLIREISAKAPIPPMGYNEAMLAVAEDSLLDKRVEERSLRLRDLVAFAAFCVAGLDMVAVPRAQVDPIALAEDLWAVYSVKKKPIGVRVIPVDGVPGDKISLGKFGKTTVAAP